MLIKEHMLTLQRSTVTTWPNWTVATPPNEIENIEKHVTTMHSTKYNFHGLRILLERRRFSSPHAEWFGPKVVSLAWWFDSDAELSAAVITIEGIGWWCCKADAWTSLGSSPGSASSSVQSCSTWPRHVGTCDNTRTLTLRVSWRFITMAGTHWGCCLWRGT